MATIVNYRDVLLQAADPRFIPPPLPQEVQDAVNNANSAVDATRGLEIYANGDQFKYDGTATTPASITFNVRLRLLSGTVTWSVVQGTATLTGTGNSRTLTPANMSTDRVRVRASLMVGATTYFDEMDVTRVRDGAAGHDGDAVDIIFRRNPVQPATPNSSIGTPSGWYSSVDQVPPNASPMWSSVGTKVGGTNIYVWQEPVKIEGSDGGAGLSVVELTIYRRLATTPATPSGGTFNFGTQTLTPPANWSWSIPTGTNPVWMSKAVVSIQGITGSSAVTGWTTPVIAIRDGNPGDDGNPGVRGTVQVSVSRSPAAWNDAAANTAITSFTGTSTRVPGDQVTQYNAAAGWAETRYWTGTAWVFLQQVIDGNLIVTGSLTADKITGGIFTGLNFRTAASGKRIEISSALNRITFFPTTGQGTYIGPSSDSGQGLNIVSPSGGWPTWVIKEGTANAPALVVSKLGGTGPVLSILKNLAGAHLNLNDYGFPSVRGAGDVFYSGGDLYISDGTHFYRLLKEQIT